LTVIASGGVRTGIDAVKAIALGADAVGLALPLLKPAVEGNLVCVLHTLIDEMKTAMSLLGTNSIKMLKQIPVVITGASAEWLRARGLKPEDYARRGIDK
jgi:isopentenyl-diphosphate delta-isomerase